MNNKTDKIVNLSHLILNKIISNLKDIVDRICFSLVCKRWYNDRDKYLIFNTDSIPIFPLNTTDINQYHKHFKLPSYNNIFIKSIQSKTDCRLFIGYTKKDYNIDDVRNLKSIPDNVSNIYISPKSFLEEEQEYLYKLISESQSVTKLDGCKTLKYGLSNSVKSVELKNFNEPLLKGSFPNSLKVLNFNNTIEKAVRPGVLPDGLHTLTLDNYQIEIPQGALPEGLQNLSLIKYRQTIRPGVLPDGLRVISFFKYQHEILPGVLPVGLLDCIFSSYDFEIKQGVLPVGLLELFVEGRYYYQYEIQPGVLPLSLERLYLYSYIPPPEPVALQPNLEDLQYSAESCLPISWLQAISSLSKLQSLTVDFHDEVGRDTTIFNVNYLPRTIKSFYCNIRTKLRGTMPTSLKRVNLDDCQFNINEIFPETLQYHFELFQYEYNSILTIASNIRIDELIICGESRESTITLPSGVGKITLFFNWLNSNENIIDFVGDGSADQSCSLRELRLPTFKDGPPKIVKLPNTIEYMDIGKNEINNILHLIPSTLRTLVLENRSDINITIGSSIKSINKIICNITKTIRKLDKEYYIMNDLSAKLIAKIFHHSKLEQILNNVQ
ncbi:hypothetical protein PPL_10925 [Heterostelium album PN500]|uniref:COI1 F-box domain-containing protein n=1 Tax=Heterostelium pallidum (strain ATCC 26659 / Pp 5 / PN500) TaxID=670386 RepID=D3BSF8_HETP5|nr:hypothetical protein PPL_10925 [Heterostelium album PN500]EFA75664.1 hypothetical protein PPL_10925 [Heterostelium album PN500]|eukprot:XP_020427798.1 hypothetical protein PPL_10925 [Heterostelium album PN500]